MNYIKELNAFYDWLDFNEVTPSAINLWHALMHICNKTGWAASFTVAESVLCIKTGLTGRTLRKARMDLKQLGRIDFVSVQGKAPRYTIISLERSEKTSAVHADVSTEPSAGVRAAVGSELVRSEEISAVRAEVKAVPSTGVGAAVGPELARSEKISVLRAAPKAGGRAALVKQNETKQNMIKQHQPQNILEEKEVVDDGYARLAIFHEQNIGPLTPHVGERLGHLEAESGAALTLLALEKAVEINATSKVNYAEAVLKSWRDRHVTTVEQARQLDKKRSAGGKKHSLFTISEETLARQKNEAKNYEHRHVDVAAFPF